MEISRNTVQQRKCKTLYLFRWPDRILKLKENETRPEAQGMVTSLNRFLPLEGIFAISGETQHLSCVHLQPLEVSRGKP